MFYNKAMNFLKWILILFIAPLPVFIGILLSIPLLIVIIVTGTFLIILLELIKVISNQKHPLKRKIPRKVYWL